jgi:hypothetical protein
LSLLLPTFLIIANDLLFWGSEGQMGVSIWELPIVPEKWVREPINIGLFKNKNKNSECTHKLINMLCWEVLNFWFFFSSQSVPFIFPPSFKGFSWSLWSSQCVPNSITILSHMFCPKFSSFHLYWVGQIETFRPSKVSIPIKMAHYKKKN